eukprot:s2009_g21.t1
MEWARDAPSGQVEYERASTEKLFSFLKSLLKFRAGSNLWHTDGQGKCAGLVSPEQALQKSTLLWFKRLAEAEAAVKATGSLAAQRLGGLPAARATSLEAKELHCGFGQTQGTAGAYLFLLAEH